MAHLKWSRWMVGTLSEPRYDPKLPKVRRCSLLVKKLQN